MLKTLLTPFVAVPMMLAAQDSSQKGAPMPQQMLKAVVHINFEDSERQGHGLKNIQNILKDVGKADIEVVCHGGGLTLVTKGKTAHAEKVQELIKHQVRFLACENTMRAKSVEKKDLLPDVGTVPSGAVEVVRKQQEGYGYFRP